MFAGVSTDGKVVNAQSNLVFELLVYVFITLVGYGLGALAFAALPYKLGLVAAIVLGLAAGAWTVRRLERAR